LRDFACDPRQAAASRGSADGPPAAPAAVPWVPARDWLSLPIYAPPRAPVPSTLAQAPQVFTAADGFEPEDLLQFARGHAASANRLRAHFEFYDSAGYLLHLAFELMFKAITLKDSGRLEAEHDLRRLIRKAKLKLTPEQMAGRSLGDSAERLQLLDNTGTVDEAVEQILALLMSRARRSAGSAVDERAHGVAAADRIGAGAHEPSPLPP
jgi:hypothetical protein